MNSPTTFRRAAVFAAFAFAIVAATSVSALERDATYYTAPADKPLTTEVSSAQLEELRTQINSLQDFFAQHPSAASSHITETGTKKYRRAFHAKGFCLRGTLKVNTGLPTDLKHGVFAAEERTYPVWVRWSNGLGSVNHDVLSDVRGMAVKVFVNGGETSAAPTLDLLSTNSPVPTTNTLQALVDFQRAMQHDGFFGDTKRIVDSAKYFHSHPETLKSLLSSVLSPLRSFAREQFWSGSPYQVGSAQVKFNFEPVKSANAEPTDGDSNRLLDLSGEVKVATLANEDGVLRGLRVWRDVLVRLEALITEKALHKDYLLNDMRERVAKRDLVYKVQLQRFVDETKTPINDLFDEWTETEAPSVPVATLTISRQAWDPALQVACENAQFNPSHGVLGHKPLGFLNHGRMSAYASSGNYRNKKNGVPLASPQSGVPPSVGGSASTAAAAPTAAAPTAPTRVK